MSKPPLKNRGLSHDDYNRYYANSLVMIESLVDKSTLLTTLNEHEAGDNEICCLYPVRIKHIASDGYDVPDLGSGADAWYEYQARISYCIQYLHYKDALEPIAQGLHETHLSVLETDIRPLNLGWMKLRDEYVYLSTVYFADLRYMKAPCTATLRGSPLLDKGKKEYSLREYLEGAATTAVAPSGGTYHIFDDGKGLFVYGEHANKYGKEVLSHMSVEALLFFQQRLLGYKTSIGWRITKDVHAALLAQRYLQQEVK